MEGLMECPFCGAKPVLVSDFKPGRNSCQTAMVRCYNCHADGYIADSCLNESEQTAIDRWNTRATDPLMEKIAHTLEFVNRSVECGLTEYGRAIIAPALQEYREMKDAKQRRDS